MRQAPKTAAALKSRKRAPRPCHPSMPPDGTTGQSSRAIQRPLHRLVVQRLLAVGFYDFEDWRVVTAFGEEAAFNERMRQRSLPRKEART